MEPRSSNNYSFGDVPYVKGDTPFPNECLERMYPNNPITYKARVVVALHFLIALGNPNETIKTFIGKLKAEKLLLADPQSFLLTPLHIAAMKANTVVATALLLALGDKGKLVLYTKDAFGYTPMHHAALTSNALYALFLQHGGNPSLKTNTGADCHDLLALAGRVSSIRSVESLYFKEASDRNPVLISSIPEQKKYIFGESFFHTDDLLLTEQSFEWLWQIKIKKEEASFCKVLKAPYDAYRNHPYKLVVVPSKPLREVSEHALDVETLEEIPKGRIVGEYTGLRLGNNPKVQAFNTRFTPDHIKRNRYLCQDIQAEQVGNESRLFNCGFPNIGLLSVPSEYGVERFIFISLINIKVGESLLWSYGMDVPDLTLGTQMILGKERMEEFYTFQGKTLIESIKRMNQKGSALTMEALAEEAFLEKALMFPLENPTALLYLHFKRMADYTLWSDHIYNDEILVFQDLIAKGNDHIQALVIFDLLKRVEQWSQKMGNQSLIADWVLSKLEKIPFMNVLKGLDMICTEIEMEEVDALLMNYDWKEDPNHPFSFENRTERLIEYSKSLPNRNDVIHAFKSEVTRLEKENPDSEAYKMNKKVLDVLCQTLV